MGVELLTKYILPTEASGVPGEQLPSVNTRDLLINTATYTVRGRLTGEFGPFLPSTPYATVTGSPSTSVAFRLLETGGESLRVPVNPNKVKDKGKDSEQEATKALFETASLSAEAPGPVSQVEATDKDDIARAFENVTVADITGMKDEKKEDNNSRVEDPKIYTKLGGEVFALGVDEAAQEARLIATREQELAERQQALADRQKALAQEAAAIAGQHEALAKKVKDFNRARHFQPEALREVA